MKQLRADSKTVQGTYLLVSPESRLQGAPNVPDVTSSNVLLLCQSLVTPPPGKLTGDCQLSSNLPSPHVFVKSLIVFYSVISSSLPTPTAIKPQREPLFLAKKRNVTQIWASIFDWRKKFPEHIANSFSNNSHTQSFRTTLVKFVIFILSQFQCPQK